MKVRQALDTHDPTLAQRLQNFAEYLLTVDDDCNPTLKLNNASTYYIYIPRSMLIPESNLLKLLLNVYEFRENDMIRMPISLHDIFINRAILTSKNIHVAKINEIMLNYLDGDIKAYLSCDISRLEDSQTLYTPDFLNSIDKDNLPSHKLDLKVGCCPIMVLRNIKTDNGLCNSARCIILALYPNIIKAVISTGSHVGKVVFIHRIKVKADEDDSVVFTRTQFPERLAFVTTINKAQDWIMNSKSLLA